MNTTKNKKVMKLRKAMAILKVVLLLVVVGGMVAFYYNTKINDLNAAHDAKLKQKEATIDSLERVKNSNQETIKQLKAENKELVETANSLISTTNKLNKELKSLQKDNETLIKENKVYKEREELYNKYEYAIFNEDGGRTDFTYDEIKYAEDLMEEKGYDPNLLLGIAMVESDGTRDCKNKNSTATGYCQLLSGTAKYVYENMLKEGSYDHSYAYNGKTNLRIAAMYIEYLVQRKGSLFAVIGGYSGRNAIETYQYIDMMNRRFRGQMTFSRLENNF